MKPASASPRLQSRNYSRNGETISQRPDPSRGFHRDRSVSASAFIDHRGSRRTDHRKRADDPLVDGRHRIAGHAAALIISGRAERRAPRESECASKQLVEIPDAQGRLISLCQGLVGRDLFCIAAGVLRMGENVQAQPRQLLCPFQFCDGTGGRESFPGRCSSGHRRSAAHPCRGTIPSGLTVNLEDVDRGVTAVIARAPSSL